ncbi:hypothetical protein R3P38DRAFT_2561495 [Favolaschia claudopus]|uniref:Transmembrane protein n=1 Tax=Favolaschia claudopus TaxID=2862362 RepID=A0AAW0A3H4_9AGAR
MPTSIRASGPKPSHFCALHNTAMNTAIIDDRDALIRYDGNWSETGGADEFNSTMTWSAVQGASASFIFVGTSVTVFGTVAASDSPQASMTFLVDGIIGGTFTPPSNTTSTIHHEALWVSPALNDGSHTLVITQTAAQTQGEIFLDYIMYDTTSSSVRSYFIDDRDPRIIYTPAWRKFGSDVDFQHTSQGSTSAGDSFRLEFEGEDILAVFAIGKSISFYGGINNGSAGQVLNASMAIDGGTSTYFVPGPQPEADTNNNLIFYSGELSEGNHTLVVTSENDFTVWVDYFVVTPNPTATGESSIPATTSNAITAHSPSKPRALVGILVGLTIGAIILIGLSMTVALVIQRRRKFSRRSKFQHPRCSSSCTSSFVPSNTKHSQITPYVHTRSAPFVMSSGSEIHVPLPVGILLGDKQLRELAIPAEVAWNSKVGESG